MEKMINIQEISRKKKEISNFIFKRKTGIIYVSNNTWLNKLVLPQDGL